MEIKKCKPADVEHIMNLYAAARQLQTERQMVIWPYFNEAFLTREIEESRQWKLVVYQTMVCNWAITFEDKEIWGEKDQADAIYIHRIATHPLYRGNRFIDAIVSWAIAYARSINRTYVRLDTLGHNTRLIEHYTSAGFHFLGMHKLTNTATLPLHYQREPNCCLFELSTAAVNL